MPIPDVNPRKQCRGDTNTGRPTLATNREAISTAIDTQLKRPDLYPGDILKLALAQRLNECSEATLEKVLGGNPTDGPRGRGILDALLND